MWVYNGGTDLDKEYRFGYSPSSKKGRVLYGVGLYTSTDPSDCYAYSKGSKKLFALDIDLESAKVSNSVLIDYLTAYHFIRGTCSKKFLKEFESVYKFHRESGEQFSLHRLHVFFCNYHPRLHLICKELNDFMAGCGAGYSITKLSMHTGQCVMIHDFSIIKSVQAVSKSTSEVSVLPEPILTRSYAWWITWLYNVIRASV